MGYDLENNYRTFFRSSNWWFLRILGLAKVAGWVPKGTYLPSVSNWNNNDYESQSGQFVSEDDAKNLFDILNNLLLTRKSINGKPVGLQSDEIDMVTIFLNFLKPSGKQNVSGFIIK
jgi:hypothetical protein